MLLTNCTSLYRGACDRRVQGVLPLSNCSGKTFFLRFRFAFLLPARGSTAGLGPSAALVQGAGHVLRAQEAQSDD